MTNLTKYQQRFNTYYPQHLPTNTDHPSDIYRAIHYSFSAGGKRLRPALVYSTADSLGIALDKVDQAALAIESIHTYSLIHDDLPAMDDDDLRRGQPACHKQFDEATAILAGDALNTFAFEVISQSQSSLSPHAQCQQIQILSHCAGVAGMVGGQALDLYFEHKTDEATHAKLSSLHCQKTGRLFEACLTMAYAANDTIDDGIMSLLTNVGQKIGLFYQIQDDILDITQSSQTLGKPSQSDIENDKITYVSLLGLNGAQEQADDLANELRDNMQQLFAHTPDNKPKPLPEIVEKIIQRQH